MCVCVCRSLSLSLFLSLSFFIWLSLFIDLMTFIHAMLVSTSFSWRRLSTFRNTMASAQFDGMTRQQLIDLLIANPCHAHLDGSAAHANEPKTDTNAEDAISAGLVTPLPRDVHLTCNHDTPSPLSPPMPVLGNLCDTDTQDTLPADSHEAQSRYIYINTNLFI